MISCAVSVLVLLGMGRACSRLELVCMKRGRDDLLIEDVSRHVDQ